MMHLFAEIIGWIVIALALCGIFFKGQNFCIFFANDEEMKEILTKKLKGLP